MSRLSLLVVVAATAFALSAGTLIGRYSMAEAAKPELVVGEITVSQVDGDCVVTVNWSGLKGGKKLHINTQLLNGTAQVGTPAFDTARQDDERLVVVFQNSGPADRASVAFHDQKLNHITTDVGFGSCS